MAAPTTNVFGDVVTGKTRVDRALKAKEDPNAGGKRDQAVAYVREQKEKFGSGVFTYCAFYNATGEKLDYAEEDSKCGHPDHSYPRTIENGQWGLFQHVGETGCSEGYVVYRGKYNDTYYCKDLIAWAVLCDKHPCNNHAFCEIYDDKTVIDKLEVYNKLEASSRHHEAEYKGIHISSSVEEGTNPSYEAHITKE